MGTLHRAQRAKESRLRTQGQEWVGGNPGNQRGLKTQGLAGSGGWAVACVVTGEERGELLSQGKKGMVVRGCPLAPPIHAGHFPFHGTREGESGDSHRGSRVNEDVQVRSQKWGEQSAGKEGILLEEESECDLGRHRGPGGTGGPGETSSGLLGQEPSAKTKSQPLRRAT